MRRLLYIFCHFQVLLIVLCVAMLEVSADKPPGNISPHEYLDLVKSMFAYNQVGEEGAAEEEEEEEVVAEVGVETKSTY